MSGSAPTASSTDRRRRIGALGEQHARHHLQRRGYRLVAAQARTRHGEIDLIAIDGPTLVFCEVKTRVARNGAAPWTSLHERKRAQVRRLAVAWLAENDDRPRTSEIRFDAILVTVDREGALRSIEQIEAAF
ncbi:MAG: YraN family protein [Patulibacter sp.]|nr:YraN family protein [Patulibacter sp.]